MVPDLLMDTLYFLPSRPIWVSPSFAFVREILGRPSSESSEEEGAEGTSGEAGSSTSS